MPPIKAYFPPLEIIFNVLISFQTEAAGHDMARDKCLMPPTGCITLMRLVIFDGHEFASLSRYCSIFRHFGHFRARLPRSMIDEDIAGVSLLSRN